MKKTKRALLLSAIAVVMSIAMLIGSTFAWFTDSASTAVNTIQSGTLKVALEYSMDNGETWQNAEGETLNWVTTDEVDNVLWEPNCTYSLPLIRVRNDGNLALKYEISVIGAKGDLELLDVIDFTASIDGKDEVALSIFTGHLDAYDASSSILIKGHMDKDAGNDYQDLEINNIAISVLATQYTYEYDSNGNQYDADVSFDDVIFALGGTYNMDAARNAGINISPDAQVIVNGNNNVIDVNGRGFQNSGNATVNNVEMKAGNAASYSNATIGADAKTTYNDVTIESAGGGIAASDGAEVIFNSGSVDVNSTSTSGRYLFYAEGEGTVITINGGNFDFNKTQNQKRAYICAINGATVYVTGGTFGKASSRNDVVYTSNGSKYSDGIITNETGKVVITGGTFGFDPSNWVADGYNAVKNADGTWTVAETPVAPQQVNGIYQVSKPAELAWLAASESKINHATLTADIDMKGATISSIEIESYRTFNGNGHKISNVVVNGNGLFENTSGQITVKNITLDNVTVNATSGNYAGIVSSKFCGFFENVTVLNSSVYAPNSEYVGGLAGAVYKNMVNCKVENISVPVPKRLAV